jgi:hypothetical protein
MSQFVSQCFGLTSVRGGAGALARGSTPWSSLVKLLLIPRSRTRASGAVQGDRPTGGS